MSSFIFDNVTTTATPGDAGKAADNQEQNPEKNHAPNHNPTIRAQLAPRLGFEIFGVRSWTGIRYPRRPHFGEDLHYPLVQGRRSE